jgi:uncharacterized phage protein (TIGR02218 family)
MGRYDGSQHTVNTSGTVNDGNFHHAAATFPTTGTCALYFDGSLVGTFNIGTQETYAKTWLANGKNSSWPQGGSGDRWFSGSIDEVLVYNRVLSASEVSQLFLAGGTDSFVYATCYTVSLFDGLTVLRFTDANVDIASSLPAPAAASTFDFNFATGQFFSNGVSVTPSSVLTCVRNLTSYARTVAGTLTSFAANTLRITNNGLLVEESRTNLALQSQTFGTTWGVNNSSVTSDAAVAPDGTTTADKLTPNTSSNIHCVFESLTATAAVYTTTCYMKAAGYNYGVLQLASGPGTNTRYTIVVDLTSGIITATQTQGSPTNVTTSVERMANGWWRLRVSMTCTADASATSPIPGVSDVASPSNWGSFAYPVFTGDGTSGVYLWGAQLELGTSPTSYIATTTASVNRPDETAIASSFGFNGAAATLYADYQPDMLDGTVRFAAAVEVSGSTVPNRMALGGSSTQYEFRVSDNTGDEYVANVTGPTVAEHKLAVTYSAAGGAAALDGASVTPVSNFPVSALTSNRLTVGNTTPGGRALNGYVKRVIYWPVNFDMATITSYTGAAYSSKGVQVDQRSSKAQAHWKRGLDVDQWTVVVAPRNVDPVTGATFPDTILGQPWIAAARAGALDGADVQVDRAYLAAWPQPYKPVVTPVGLITVFAGRIAEVDTSDTIVVLTINDYRELLAQKMPRNVYLAQCRHTLYDAGCTLNPASFKVSFTALSGSTQLTLMAAATAPPGSGTFQLGKVTMTSGQNSGFSRTVHTWSAGTFLLLNPLPFPVAAGDTFDAFAGCNKLLSTCAAFSNTANFGGEPYIPAAETAV